LQNNYKPVEYFVQATEDELRRSETFYKVLPIPLLPFNPVEERSVKGLQKSCRYKQQQ